MNRSVFKFPSPEMPLEWTGERYVSSIGGAIQHEHYHRYLYSLKYCQNKIVLDVASGEGYGSYLLGQVAASVIGIDIDKSAVDFANRHYLSDRVSYRQGDAASLPIDDQSVDVVVSFETIEHIAQQERFIEDVARVLRHDGILVISSPDRMIYSNGQVSANPYHLRELDKREFLALLSPEFVHIKLFEQRALLGSVIFDESKEGTASVEGFETSDGLMFERSLGLPNAMYLIAIASRQPLPATPNSAFHSQSAEARAAEMTEQYEKTTERCSQLTAQCAQLQAVRVSSEERLENLEREV